MLDVSFVIPCLNEQKNIWACLNSIQGELRRNPDVRGEIIVADNGSRDTSAVIASMMGANVVIVPKRGIVPARQKGFETSRGALVAFIDADNVLPLNWLPKALAAFTDKEVVAISGPLVYHDLAWYIRGLSKIFYVAAHASHQMFPMLQGGNFVMRRAALESAGGMDESAEFWGEDTHQAIRVAQQGKVKFLPDLWIYSSGRRLKGDGVLKTTFLYVLNYYSAHLLGRPVTKGLQQDFR